MTKNAPRVIDINDMKEEALRLLDLQEETYKKIQSEIIDQADVSELIEIDEKKINSCLSALRNERKKLQNLEMVLAVVGTMKAGKSTSINAIVGREVLPNRNRPMTALPTLIRHQKSQTQPVLTFEKVQPIIALIKEIGQKLDCYPPEHISKILFKDDPHLITVWQGIHDSQSILNKSRHEGENDIYQLLAWLNDLVRLAKALELKFPFDQYTEISDFPVIEVEFFHLADIANTDDDAKFSILDTPGFNEEGQQDDLLPMMIDQLHKATAVLAVMDYTQLKSKSDGDLRAQLIAIAEQAKGRMFVLANKFDQEGCNSDDREETKRYIARNLLEGLNIEENKIFPVSSKNAYLSKRAELAIEIEGGIKVHPDKRSWEQDFGKLVGRNWKHDYQDNIKVRRFAKEIWEESFFGEPLEKVIRFSYSTSASHAIASAANLLKSNYNDIKANITGRLQSSALDSEKLKQQINAVNKHIQRVQIFHEQSQEQIQNHKSRLEEEVSQEVKSIARGAEDTITSFLNNGSLSMVQLYGSELRSLMARKIPEFKRATAPEQERMKDEVLKLLPDDHQACRQLLDRLQSTRGKMNFGGLKLFFPPRVRIPRAWFVARRFLSLVHFSKILPKTTHLSKLNFWTARKWFSPARQRLRIHFPALGSTFKTF